MSMESRKFEAADLGEALYAALYHQYEFVDGHETSELPPPLVTSMFLPKGQPMKGQMHPLRHHFTAWM